MNEISLHCHLLYFSSIILTFGQYGKEKRDLKDFPSSCNKCQNDGRCQLFESHLSKWLQDMINNKN